MAKRRTASDEFGTFNWDDAWSAPAESPRAQAINEMEKRIAKGDLKPLRDRAPIEDDPFMPRDFYEAWYGGYPKGPSIPEQHQLAREYTGEIDRLLNLTPQQLAEQQHEPAGRVEGRPNTPEEMAELLWSEFRASYPNLARDANAVEAAAKRIIEGGGLNPDNRGDFYKRVARELGHDS